MHIKAPQLDLVELAKASMPHCPLGPEVALHWLAIDSVQPNIAENPTQLPSSVQDFPSGLSKELQTFYQRTTDAMRGGEGAKTNLRSIYDSLASDKGLQELVPYYSRFMYTEVRNVNRSLPLLRNLVKALHAMMRNPYLKIYHRLQIFQFTFITFLIKMKYFRHFPSIRKCTLNDR